MITVTRIREGKGKIKAFCDIEIDEKFAVKGFRVVEEDDGNVFVGLPSKKGSDNVNYATFIPRDPLKGEIEQAILDAVIEYEPDCKDITKLAVQVADQLHDGKERIVNKPVSQFKEGKVRAVTVANYKFITQNPEKDSVDAKMARKGHKITWVIRNEYEWVGKVVNGIYRNLNR